MPELPSGTRGVFFLQARPAWHDGAWHVLAGALAGVLHKSTARKNSIFGWSLHMKEFS